MNQRPDPLLFRNWARDVLEIRTLFHDRKYKRCAARCEELQAGAVHPVHQSFLGVYQAFCYEELGRVAHIYSENKLVHLDKAREGFETARNILKNEIGEAFPSETSDEIYDVSTLEQVLESPAYATLDVLESYQFPSPGDLDGGAPACQSAIEQVNITPHGVGVGIGKLFPMFDKHISPASSIYSPEELPHTVSNIHTSTPCPKQLGKSLIPVLSPSRRPLSLQVVTKTPQLLRNKTPNHKYRLSQNLGSSRSLVEDLIPSPLFRRTQPPRVEAFAVFSSTSLVTSKKPPNPALFKPINASFEPFTPSGKDIESNKENIPPELADDDIDKESDDEDDNETEAFQERALPPLPFNHKPTFLKRGSRHILVPSTNTTTTVARKTTTNHVSHPTRPAINSPPTQPKSHLLKPRTPSAITNLITQFESKILESTSTSSTYSTPPPPTTFSPTSQSQSLYPYTPLTPRFTQIQHAFAIKPSPSTTTPSSNTPTPHFLTHLSSLTNALESHMHTVDTTIEDVKTKQSERKAKGFRRSMSFWSFEPVARNVMMGKEGVM